MKLQFFLLSLVVVTQGHVRLNFPLARDLPLDFLDNFRTKAPCGMPKGDTKDKLVAGSTFNVTWHLAYPHQGGYKLELLDQNEDLLQSLTPEDGGSNSDGWLDSDTTAQSHLLTLPKDLVCQGCSIRLQRQALEWGRRYRFWSCSDVDIIPSTDDLEKGEICSFQGNYVQSQGTCKCFKNYYGSRCQYKNECDEDSDCLNGGRCIDIKSTTAPEKECFCADGFFGKLCERVSSITNEDIKDVGSFSKRSVSDQMDIYWKIMEKSTEALIMLRGKTNSFLALGWRPTRLALKCEALIEDDEPESDSKQSSPEIPRRKKSDTKQIVNTRMNPMDCNDIIIGMARDNYHRVYDAYTRDRSTPQPDSFFGGDESLLGATGSEDEDGWTTIAFHRKLKADDFTDWDIKDELMNVVWAMGQEFGNYDHRPASGLERGSASLQDFYRPDEVKYHGKGRRGAISLNFLESPVDIVSGLECSAWQWKHPANCESNECQYKAKVKNIGGNKLMVSVTRKLQDGDDGKSWIGIGFSETPTMVDSDIVLGFMNEMGEPFVGDYWANSYTSPKLDESQDITDMSLKVSNGFMKMRFKKLLNSNDIKEDANFQKELYLLFPYSGGPLFGSSIGIHKELPVVSPVKFSLTAPCPGDFDEGGEAEGEPEGEPETEPEGEPEGAAAGEAEGEPEGGVEKRSAREAGEGEPEGEPEGEAEGEPESEAEGEPEGGVKKRHAREVAEGEPEGEAEGEAEGEPEKAGEKRSSKMFDEGEPEAISSQSGCHGESWGHPEGCSDRECQYLVRWRRSEEFLHVKVQQKEMTPGTWIAIGFSKNPFMPRSDLVLGYFDGQGKPHVQDMWIRSYSLQPSLDSSQDLHSVNLTSSDGFLKMEFAKRLGKRSDRRDVDFTAPLHMIFPHSPGSVNRGSDGEVIISKHQMTPHVTTVAYNFLKLNDSAGCLWR